MSAREPRSAVPRDGRDRPRWHGAARLAALVIAAAGATLAMAASVPTVARKAVYPARFPAGPGASVAEASCVACHSPMLVTQQHKDSTGWEKTVHTMETWGVQLSAPERDSLMVYLRGHFGPAPAK